MTDPERIVHLEEQLARSAAVMEAASVALQKLNEVTEELIRERRSGTDLLRKQSEMSRELIAVYRELKQVRQERDAARARLQTTGSHN